MSSRLHSFASHAHATRGFSHESPIPILKDEQSRRGFLTRIPPACRAKPNDLSRTHIQSCLFYEIGPLVERKPLLRRKMTSSTRSGAALTCHAR